MGFGLIILHWCFAGTRMYRLFVSFFVFLFRCSLFVLLFVCLFVLPLCVFVVRLFVSLLCLFVFRLFVSCYFVLCCVFRVWMQER